MLEKRERAIKRIRAGDKAAGKQLLIKVLKAHPQDDEGWVWIGLPLVLLFVGGAIGGAVGGVGASINLRIFRSRASGLKKFLAMLLVTAGAVVAYVVLATVAAMALIDAGIIG